jgi:hypothetical protein
MPNRQPGPTPDVGWWAWTKQVLKDYWLWILSILLAFILGLLLGRFVL